MFIGVGGMQQRRQNKAKRVIISSWSNRDSEWSDDDGRWSSSRRQWNTWQVTSNNVDRHSTGGGNWLALQAAQSTPQLTCRLLCIAYSLHFSPAYRPIITVVCQRKRKKRLDRPTKIAQKCGGGVSYLVSFRNAQFLRQMQKGTQLSRRFQSYWN